MDTESRIELVSQNLQEIITKDELRNLIETNERPRGYVGFEPSGIMHAGTGLIVGKKMMDYVEPGNRAPIRKAARRPPAVKSPAADRSL